MPDSTTLHSAPVTTAVEPSVAAPNATAKRGIKFDDKYLAPILVTLILLVGEINFGILQSYPQTATAICTSILMELVLGKMFTGKMPHLASAYISGISIGMIVRSELFWPYALCAAISITSKYVIRWNGRHLWNPSNLGIVAMIFLAHESVATLSIQWGNAIYPALVIWSLGCVIIYRLKRFHICFTYIACFVGYALLRAVVLTSAVPLGNRFLTEVAPITGPMYQLFIFFMITDPKTTVKSRQGQMLVAFLVATAECAIRLTGSLLSNQTFTIYAAHAPYIALFLMGPSANMIEIYRTVSAKRREPAAVAA